MERLFFHGTTDPSGPGPPHCKGFTITLRHMTFDRTPLDEPDAETSTVTTDRHPCPPKGFEPTIPASERPKIHALDRAVTGIGVERLYVINYSSLNCCLIASISDFFTTAYI